MKKKGFTLIELLAVIVILAIIALILVPIVSDVIETSRKQAFKESVNGIIDSTNNYLNEYILEHNNELDEFPVVFTCDGTSCSNGSDILAFKGNTPKSGRIIIQRDGVLAEYITDSKYCAYGYKWNMVVEKSCGDVDVTKPTITGTQSGKNVALTMTDGESGIDSYCATNVENPSGCTWVSVTGDSVNYEILSAGTWYFYAKDKKGNISDSINFTTTSADYCGYTPNTVVYESGTVGDGTLEIPIGCTGTYKLEVWGAQSGTILSSGVRGGYTVGNVVLTSADELYIVVGGQNGYNGGASRGSGGASGEANNGGGATHIAKKDNSYTTLSSYNNETTAINYVYVVAGGGGGSYQGWGGGYGGGVTGGTGGTYKHHDGGSVGGGSGATQTSGCAFGRGCSGGCSKCGGGGGGWYGGNGAYCSTYDGGGGGGGGSGYVNTYLLVDGQTIAGNAEMPTHDGTSTMTGNGGNGYAKITYIDSN